VQNLHEVGRAELGSSAGGLYLPRQTDCFASSDESHQLVLSSLFFPDWLQFFSAKR